MDNTSLPSRRNARVVGYIDLALILAQLLCAAAVALVGKYYPENSVRLESTDHDDDNSGGGKLVPVPDAQKLQDIHDHDDDVSGPFITICIFFFYFFRSLSAFRLINSTRPGLPVHLSWKLASFWRWTTITIFLLRFVGAFYYYRSAVFWGVILVSSSVDLIFMYFVCRYVSDLAKLLPTNNNYQEFANPTSPKADDSGVEGEQGGGAKSAVDSPTVEVIVC